MRPTRLNELLVAAGAGVLLGGLLIAFGYTGLPALSYIAPAGLGVLALLEAWSALLTRARLHGRPGTMPISPFTAARFAALAKASSALGSFLAGGWAGALVWLLVRGTPSPLVHTDERVSGAGLLASLLLVAAALWLEHVCKVRGDDDEDSPNAAPRTGARTS